MFVDSRGDLLEISTRNEWWQFFDVGGEMEQGSDGHERARARRPDEDELITAALVVGGTYAEAGTVAGVSERTVRRRMADPEFAAEVSRRRGERVAGITGQLVSIGPDAIGVIRDCMAADTAGVRLRAAQLALALGVQFRHAQELEARLVALETARTPDGGGQVD